MVGKVSGIVLGEQQNLLEVLRVAAAAATWHRQESPPQSSDATVLYVEADNTGLPTRAEVLTGSKGKAPNGQAKKRMAALGCVFTQRQLDEEGSPQRDCQSSTYLSGVENPSEYPDHVTA